MSLDQLDPVFANTKRLAALGMVAKAQEVEFSFVRDHLELSDSDLSKQMKALVDAGYVTSKKRGAGGDRKTWFRATRAGERALTVHMDALNRLVLDSLPPPRIADAERTTKVAAKE